MSSPRRHQGPLQPAAIGRERVAPRLIDAAAALSALQKRLAAF